MQIALVLLWKRNNSEIFNYQSNYKQLDGSNEIKIHLVYTILKIIYKSDEIWKSLLSYSEIFKPFHAGLNQSDIKMKIIAFTNVLLTNLYNNLLRVLHQKIFVQTLKRKQLQLIHKEVKKVIIKDTQVIMNVMNMDISILSDYINYMERNNSEILNYEPKYKQINEPQIQIDIYYLCLMFDCFHFLIFSVFYKSYLFNYNIDKSFVNSLQTIESFVTYHNSRVLF